MGYRLLDQYSLLHAAIGVVAYFWNIPLLTAVVLHVLFEFAENTPTGMWAINKYIIDPGYFSWPGGKHKADTLLNQTGDNLAFVVGWLLSAWLDVEGTREHWYVQGSR